MRILLPIGLLIFVAAAIAYPTLSSDGNSRGVLQDTCPVTGKAVDQNIYADYQGERVYFCSEDSRKKFLENPASYQAALTKIREDAAERLSARNKKRGSDCGS